MTSDNIVHAPSLRESPKPDVPHLGCDYTGHEFGASYPDSVCIDGYLWDADSADDGLLTKGGEWACPRCNTAQMLTDAQEEAGDGSCGLSMFTPWCGAVIWETACAKAMRENAAVAGPFLAGLPPFEASDWPDRDAVYAGRAPWDATIATTYLGNRKDGSSPQNTEADL